MAYTTPVLDWLPNEYLNVADWNRIYSNSDYVHDLLLSLIGVDLDFNELSTATTAWIITVEDELNPMLENIETMRLWAETYIAGLVDDPAFVEVKDDWTAGHQQTAPNYTHANSWEKVMDLLNDALIAYTAAAVRKPVCGVATCGSGLTQQNSWRG